MPLTTRTFAFTSPLEGIDLETIDLEMVSFIELVHVHVPKTSYWALSGCTLQ